MAFFFCWTWDGTSAVKSSLHKGSVTSQPSIYQRDARILSLDVHDDTQLAAGKVAYHSRMGTTAQVLDPNAIVCLVVLI